MKSLALALLFSASLLRADINQAKALYNSGLKLQTQKQYQAAIADYEKSLVAEPRYAYSYKQIGTCKYYLNDQAGALAAYEKYYAAVPTDAGVKGLIDRLKASGAAPAAATANAAPAEATSPSGLWHSGFALSVGGGFNTYGMKDWNDLYTTPPTSPATRSGGPINSGFEIGLNAGYSIGKSMKIGLDIDYLMASTSIVYKSNSGSGYTSTDNESAPVLWLGPEFDYAFVNFGAMRLRGQLGLGYMMLSGAGATYSSSDSFGNNSAGSSTYSGTGFGMKIGLGLDWALSKTFSFGFDLGYRPLASISPITYTNKNTSSGGYSYTSSGVWQKTDPKTFAVTNMSLDYSGLHTRLGLNFVF